MAKHISEKRKSAYYFGMGLIILGFILFVSTFVISRPSLSDFSNFDSRVNSVEWRALGGIFLVIVGSIIRRIGARGLAGSGVILDPDKARQDFEPYSRMAGGMIKDALEETNVNPGKSERVIMIRCQSCGKLNEEDSKFCQQCGKRI